MGPKRRNPQSFEDLVRAANLGMADKQRTVEHWPLPIRDGRWIDGQGVEWLIRGHALKPA
jgi:hypothetical protein